MVTFKGPSNKMIGLGFVTVPDQWHCSFFPKKLGELTKVTSSREPNNPAYVKELLPEEYEVKIGDLATDGSQFRPFIVWFGEAVPMIETAIDYVEKADIFVIIGTSLNVYPAAGLLNYVPRRGSCLSDRPERSENIFGATGYGNSEGSFGRGG